LLTSAQTKLFRVIVSFYGIWNGDAKIPVACSGVRQRNFNSISLLDLLETENTNLKNTIIGYKYLAQPGIRFLFEEYLQTK